MTRRLVVSLVLSLSVLGLFLGSRSSSDFWASATADAQEGSPTELFSQQQLDNLLAPIALYPDPLLAQVLLAATFVDQIDEASRWLRAHNNPNAIDNQPWDVSVKAVAHYSSVLYMMSDQLDWTTSVGQAYVYQSTDVMSSIQRLRALAHAAGNLVTSQQQEILVDGGVITIVPAQPQYIYVPAYYPQIIYFGPAAYYGLTPASIIFFGPPFFIGAWLNYGCDWHSRRIYYHGWVGGGWIARSRPIIRITNIYVNSRYTNVQINRNIIHQHVNYINLNRYNSVHRDVNYNNLIQGRRADTRNANVGNKTIRRNLDVTDPRLDSYHGRPPAQEPTGREERAAPPAPIRQGPSAPVEQRPFPPISPRAPQVLRPAPQLPPRVAPQPPATVFGGSGSVIDPRASSQRGQESRGRLNQPTPRPQAVAPASPAIRSIPSAPGRR